MKNILGTENNLDLFNEDGVRVYAYRKWSDGYFQELTFDSNQNIITYKDSDGFSYEATYDSDNKELTYKNSDGLTRGFDKTYNEEEVEFIKRAVHQYWEIWNSQHPDNKNDLKLTQQILNK